MPKMGNAQIYQMPTSSPAVTAAGARWQINSERVVVDGIVYSPTRATGMFDARVMVRVGIYQGVPVYRGLPVYRETAGAGNEIRASVVKPVASHGPNLCVRRVLRVE